MEKKILHICTRDLKPKEFINQISEIFESFYEINCILDPRGNNDAYPELFKFKTKDSPLVPFTLFFRAVDHDSLILEKVINHNGHEVDIFEYAMEFYEYMNGNVTLDHDITLYHKEEDYTEKAVFSRHMRTYYRFNGYALDD